MAVRDYWVSFTGGIRSGNGDFEPTDPALLAFLRDLVGNLIADDDGTGPAVLNDGTGRVVISAVFRAPSEGNAVDFARAVFSDAIDRAGGRSHLPDAGHVGWRAHELLDHATATVRELVAVG